MKKLISAPLAAFLAASMFTVPAYAEETQACTSPGYKVTGGSLKWGVKQTFRSYIKGPIAKGTWKTTGLSEVGAESTNSDFYFEFPVDPDKSKVFLDEAGNIDAALVETKDSGIGFTGHHGTLSTEILSPYVRVHGSKTEVGSTYIGYYAPGKTMPNYKESDRIPENRTEGKDTFTAGELQTPKITKKDGSDSYTIEFSSSGLKYVPKPGTRVVLDPDGNRQYIEGVDVLFLGFYEKGEEFDDYTVTLDAEKTCLDSEADQTLKKGLKDETLPAKITIERGGDSQLSQGLKDVSSKLSFAEKDASTEPTTPETPAQQDNKPKKEKSSNSSKDTDFGEIRDGWSIFLAVAGAISMFAILAKLLEDIIKPFLPKF